MILLLFCRGGPRRGVCWQRGVRGVYRRGRQTRREVGREGRERGQQWWLPLAQKCIAFVKFAYRTHTHIYKGGSALLLVAAMFLHYTTLSCPTPLAPSCRLPRQSQVNYLFVHFRWPRSHKNVIYFTASTCCDGPSPLPALYIPSVYTCVYLVHSYM